MALTLAQKGNDVIIVYRTNENEANEVVSEIEKLGRSAAAVQLDVADTKAFKGFFETISSILKEKWGRETFDFLINNAGIDRYSAFADTTEEDFDELINVHFKGVYFLTQKALPLLADGGRIVNLSSGLARFATPGYAAYGSIKGAIEVFTRYLAKELGSRGITANVVAPGIIHTDFTKRAFASYEGMEAHMNSLTALGRVGEPEDIGGVVAFLCSKEAGWVNAQRIEASGGMNL